MSKSLFSCALALAVSATALFAAAPKSTAPKFAPPPLISPAEAQKHVDFKIGLPKAVPAGFRLIGARVGAVRSIKPSNKPPKKIKMFGYGIMMAVHSKSDKVVQVGSLPGSPAAHAGLPWQGPSTLLSVNGVEVKPNREALAKIHAQLGKAVPPIKIVFKDAAGKVHTITLAHKASYFVPGPPMVTVTLEPRAALLYRSKAGGFVIVESKARRQARFLFPGKPWTEKVGAIQVLFYNTKQAPNATFIKSGVRFDVAQPKGYISEAQIKRMAASL